MFFEQTIIVDMETIFIIRKHDKLDDLLFDTTCSYFAKGSSGRLFDNIDMVFITGDPYTRTWSP